MRSVHDLCASDVADLRQEVQEIRNVDFEWLKNLPIPTNRLEIAEACGVVKQEMDNFFATTSIEISKSRRREIIRRVNQLRIEIRKVILQKVKEDGSAPVLPRGWKSKDEKTALGIAQVRELTAAYFGWTSEIPAVGSLDWTARRGQLQKHSISEFRLAGIHQTVFRRTLGVNSNLEVLEKAFPEFDLGFSESRCLSRLDWSSEAVSIAAIREKILGDKTVFEWESFSSDKNSEEWLAQRAAIVRITWRKMVKLSLYSSFGKNGAFKYYSAALIASFPEYELSKYEFSMHWRQNLRHNPEAKLVDWSSKEESIEAIRAKLCEYFGWDSFPVDKDSQMWLARRNAIISVKKKDMLNLKLAASFRGPAHFGHYDEALIASFPEYELSEYEFSMHWRQILRRLPKEGISVDVSPECKAFCQADPEERKKILHDYVARYGEKVSGLQFTRFTEICNLLGENLDKYGFDAIWSHAKRYIPREDWKARYAADPSLDAPIGGSDGLTLHGLISDAGGQEFENNADLSKFLSSVPESLREELLNWAANDDALEALSPEALNHMADWREKNAA